MHVLHVIKNLASVTYFTTNLCHILFFDYKNGISLIFSPLSAKDKDDFNTTKVV